MKGERGTRKTEGHALRYQVAGGKIFSGEREKQKGTHLGDRLGMNRLTERKVLQIIFSISHRLSVSAMAKSQGLESNMPYTVEIYQNKQGQRPFEAWVNRLRDRRAQAAIDNRIRRLSVGNLGDYRLIDEGIGELKIDIGPGYRVYFRRIGQQIILLLCGGDKRSQRRDIERAKQYWNDYQERVS